MEKRHILIGILAVLVANTLYAQQKTFNPEDYATYKTSRADGRYASSRAIGNQLMKAAEPMLQFRPEMAREEFATWKSHVKQAMTLLMKHPIVKGQPAPKRVHVTQREGYRVEKWEAYPFEKAVVSFLMLVPDNASGKKPLPAIFCTPGWGQTKEGLAGEPSLNKPGEEYNPQSMGMARQYVREGYITVVVDNPGSGECCDTEWAAGLGSYDFATFGRAMLELNWSYLGYSSYVSKLILDWVKRLPEVRRDRIIFSGFSFGTEPLMAIGVMDDEIYAFVYNDYLCRTRERILTMTKPQADGHRSYPNDIAHLIPGFLMYFDFPDLVAALAPRPVICPEGGMDRDFRLVRKAFEVSGNPDGFLPIHYKMYQDASTRQVDLEHQPEGIDVETHFRLANVDPLHHGFKAEYVLPWVKELLKE